MRIQWHEQLWASAIVGTYRKECLGNTKITSSDGSVTLRGDVVAVHHRCDYCKPSYFSEWLSDESSEAS
jgi:hypothetical protein